jgi:superfamily II DNA or RNA helicase
MQNYLKGIEYEIFIRDYLLQDNKIVYLWNDIPLDDLIQIGLFKNYEEKLIYRRECYLKYNKHKCSDIGCDILYYKDNIPVIVQCKNYSKNVYLNKLGGFFGFLLKCNHYSNSLGELYYTSDLSFNVKMFKCDVLKYIKKDFITENISDHNSDFDYEKLKPYDYQLEAYDKIKNLKKSILQLPCGMGKTLISIMWAKQFDIIIIFSPLMQHALQNKTRFQNELDNYVSLLIDSDGSRDINLITKKLKKKTILSVTYKSVDIIYELLDKINNYKSIGIVIDEFHNLNYDNMYDEEDMFYKVLNQDKFNYLFVSATPRLFDDDLEDVDIDIGYSYDFAKAIQNNYICNYDIFVPNISIKKDECMNDIYEYLNVENKNIDYDIKAQFLLRGMEENGHSKCICYCKDIEETNIMKESFSKIAKYHELDLYLECIVSDTSEKDRKQILEDFINVNKKAIIFSVRILDECIDIKECDCVYLTNKQNNKIRTIQRICRANRKDNKKINKKSGVYVWADEYNDMIDLISNLKEFDSSFSIEKIKLCNINNNVTRLINDNDNKEFKQEYEKLENVVIGVKKVDSWMEKLEQVKKYIDEHEERPSSKSKNKNISRLGMWISDQQKKNKKQKGILKNETVKKIWLEFIEKYHKYFMDSKEIWFNRLILVEQYINQHKMRPSRQDNNNDIKSLGNWINNQLYVYKTRTDIMKDDDIYNKWMEFMNKYKEYFIDHKEAWFNRLILVEEYIKNYNSKPSTHDKNDEIKSLGLWLSYQKSNYKNRTEIMKYDEIYNKWIEFMDKYKKYFMDEKEIWFNRLILVEQYINENKKRPSQYDKNNEIKLLGLWVCHQIQNYKKQKGIMKDDEIYNKWTEFMNKYKEYFMDNKKIWFNNLLLVEQYINKYNKRPSSEDINNDIKFLGNWIGTQIKNYKSRAQIMKDDEVYNKWINFMNAFQEHFIDYKENWFNNLLLVEQYINKYKKRPTVYEINDDINFLGNWLGNQIKNYKKRTGIMKDEEIYNKLTDFFDKYNEIFINSKEAWFNRLILVEKYINEYKKRPSQHDKNNEIKILGRWIGTQIKNYKKQTNIMKDNEVYDKWTEFINKYKEYFNND